MRSNLARAGVAIAAIAAAVVLFVVLQSGNDEQTTTTTTSGTPAQQTEKNAKPVEPQPVTVTVRDAKPVGGVKQLDHKKGDRVRLVVRSDVADEVHVHGYDLKKDVAAGGSVSFNFPASLEGVFEIELESRTEQIAELRVEPR
jgi:hypothetical protein